MVNSVLKLLRELLLPTRLAPERKVERHKFCPVNCKGVSDDVPTCIWKPLRSSLVTGTCLYGEISTPDGIFKYDL
jgi:hypothetical protein